MKSPHHLLVFRFSALGDVAMTVPVVKSLLQQYPSLHVTYVSNAFVAPLFTGIERLHFHAADLKGRHHGLKGLFDLYRELNRAYDFDAIADLHNVLRTQILRFFFTASFKKIAVIDKGRKEKKELTRKEQKVFKPLKSTIQRYADVFAALGLPVQSTSSQTLSSASNQASSLYSLNPPLTSNAYPHVSSPSNSHVLPSISNTNDPSPISNLIDPTLKSGLNDPSFTPDLNDFSLTPDLNDPLLTSDSKAPSVSPGLNSYFLIGVAPFAQHAEKMYPHEKMKEVLRLLLQHQNIKVLLFGGGKSEISLLQQWEREMFGLESVAGKMSFQEELKLIAELDLMVSMDSANMHLASLSGVPVISIWGSTHPFAGFYGWGQSPDDAIQVDLYCRPCSVFGNRPCFRGDLACMNSISPVVVYNKIMEKVQKQKNE